MKNDQLQIEKLICGTELYQLASNPENQKLFPFYVYTNFNSAGSFGRWEPNEGIQEKDVLHCAYCGEEIEPGNSAGYFCAYIIFEKPGVVKPCCSIHCRFKEKVIYDYGEQIYGNSDPIRLTKEQSKDIRFKVIYNHLFYNSQRYMLASFEKITDRFLREKNIWTGDHCSGGAGKEGHHRIDCKYVSFSKTIGGKPVFKLTRAQVVKLINEVLAENYRGKQLQLF